MSFNGNFQQEVDPSNEERVVSNAAQTLLVERDGAWFQVGEADKVHLARRKPLRRILVGLARARERTPDRGLICEELLAVGWPGEQVLPAAGGRRVRVALCELRKMGLRDVLIRDDSGYRLKAHLRRVDDFR